MKKGFLFYIGFFLLIVFGFAIIGLVILFCSPGTELLGFKYFSHSGTKLWETTTDDSATPLELGTAEKYSRIEIDAGYASVKIQKSNSYEKDGVVIVNNAKGFLLAKNEVKYNFSILVDGDVLKIKITEPEGFLYFSTDIQIIIHIADREADPFAETDFVINTKGGNVTVGGNESSAYSYDFNVGDLTIKTESGTVAFTTRVNYNVEKFVQTIPSLNLNIGSGKFTCRSEIMSVAGDLVLQSTSGRFTFDKIVGDGNTAIKTESGTYNINKFVTEMLNIECENGYFNIDEIVGSVKFPNQDINMASPNLKSNSISGDLVVISGESVIIDVLEVNGDVNVVTKGGSVYIGKTNEGGIGGSAVINTTTGAIRVSLKDGNNKAKEFTTDTGGIEVNLLGQVLDNSFVKTNRGQVRINFIIGKAYTFDFAYANSTETFNTDRVKFVDFPNVELSGGHYEYNKGATPRGTVEIYTDSNITLALINPAA